MYIIFKDTPTSQAAIQKIVKMDPKTKVNQTWATVIVKTTNQMVCVVQVIERQVKVWKAGEPHDSFLIYFKDLVSIQDL